MRLPGFVLGAEVIVGMPEQTLTLRHDAGSSAKPYVRWQPLATTNSGAGPQLNVPCKRGVIRSGVGVSGTG